MTIPLMEIEPDILFTNAWFTPETNQPAVYWQLNQSNGVIPLVEARARAQALFQAVGYAEGEAAIVKGMIHLHQKADRKSSGFGWRPQTAEMEALKVAAQLREFLKTGRSPLLEGVEVIFGLRTRKALINVSWYGKAVQWESSQALEHAIILVETAEAAESDAYFRWFLIERIGVQPKETYPLIAEFQTFRNRRQLEEMFQGGDHD
ncbi:MAG: hypothetical protein WCA35_22785 [Kovacikia sp.]